MLDARGPPPLHDFVVGIIFDLIELVCIDFAFDNIGHDERDVRVNTFAMVSRRQAVGLVHVVAKPKSADNPLPPTIRAVISTMLAVNLVPFAVLVLNNCRELFIVGQLSLVRFRVSTRGVEKPLTFVDIASPAAIVRYSWLSRTWSLRTRCGSLFGAG